MPAKPPALQCCLVRRCPEVLATNYDFQFFSAADRAIQRISQAFRRAPREDSGMGARTIRSAATAQRNRRERRVLLTIGISVIGPLLLAGYLVSLDLRPDLSDLSARKGNVGIVAWPDLMVGADLRRSKARPRLPDSSTKVRMMGYMMDGERSVPDGALVSSFILMSDAGQLFHPAHLEPSHMVNVSLEHPVAFQYRKLVSVSGYLRRINNRPRYGESAWQMVNADLQPASSNLILDWFEP